MVLVSEAIHFTGNDLDIGVDFEGVKSEEHFPATGTDDAESESLKISTLSGMGAAMSKILGRDLPERNPVFTKRKTPLMKELEMGKQMRQKKRRLDKEIDKTDVRKVTEKAMRKTATRAVVALFNAIATHQHPKTDKSILKGKNAHPNAQVCAIIEESFTNNWTRGDCRLDEKPNDSQ
jgi:hypothetical protein